MKKRSECTCPCHEPGVQMLHIVPCCYPDEAVTLEEITTPMKNIYLVGGAIRDKLLGIEPKDLDYVVVGYTPKEFIEEHPGAELVGKSFPVYVYKGDEYAFARIERSTGMGHKDFSVTYDTSVGILDDLQRRDLTINAIAFQEESSQLFYGHPSSKDDIANKVLRPVSMEAFTEDPLRVLRAARFAAKFPDFTISDDLYNACYSARHTISKLPKERIWAEVEKALACPEPSRFFNFLAETLCLGQWFDELDRCQFIPAGPLQHHPEGDVFTHLMQVLDRTAKLTVSTTARFAALCHDLGKIASDPKKLPSHHGHAKAGVDIIEVFCKRINAPNKFRDAAMMMAEEHMKVHTIWELRPGKAVKLCLRINKFQGGVDGFLAVVESDGNEMENLYLIQEACFVLPQVMLPEEYHGRGKACGDILLNLRAHAWKQLKERLNTQHVK